MVIKEIYDTAINPALGYLPAKMRSKEALVMMIAIGLQESRLIYRKQVPNGPAKGLWQFERGGGVKGVLNHASSSRLARSITFDLIGSTLADIVHDELEFNDILAAILCRLLLWTDPKALPKTSDSQGAWDLYLRIWRPGKPHRRSWDDFHKQAVEFVSNLA